MFRLTVALLTGIVPDKFSLSLLSLSLLGRATFENMCLVWASVSESVKVYMPLCVTVKDADVQPVPTPSTSDENPKTKEHPPGVAPPDTPVHVRGPERRTSNDVSPAVYRLPYESTPTTVTKAEAPAAIAPAPPWAGMMFPDTRQCLALRVA